MHAAWSSFGHADQPPVGQTTWEFYNNRILDCYPHSDRCLPFFHQSSSCSSQNKRACLVEGYVYTKSRTVVKSCKKSHFRWVTEHCRASHQTLGLMCVLSRTPPVPRLLHNPEVSDNPRRTTWLFLKAFRVASERLTVGASRGSSPLLHCAATHVTWLATKKQEVIWT